MIKYYQEKTTKNFATPCGKNTFRSHVKANEANKNYCSDWRPRRKFSCDAHRHEIERAMRKTSLTAFSDLVQKTAKCCSSLHCDFYCSRQSDTVGEMQNVGELRRVEKFCADDCLQKKCTKQYSCKIIGLINN